MKQECKYTGVKCVDDVMSLLLVSSESHNFY
jgi:hypothetical protein